MPKRRATQPPRILVVYKQVPPPSKRIPTSAGKNHLRTLDLLYHTLQLHGVTFRAVPIDQLGPVGNVDLVITVGGDGTVLATSHFVTTQPILGIKSFGQTSVGYFCAATRPTLATVLTGILRGVLRPHTLTRLQATIDGHTLEERILNECLFAHCSPAAISNYKLTIGKRTEVQRSSGIWVSTAAGSTAAIRGAGGQRMRLGSTRMQYRVREPYTLQKPYALLGGILPGTETIRIESLIPHGTFAIDGAHIQYPIPEGATITIRRAAIPLKIFWG